MTFWRSVVAGCVLLLAGCANAPQTPTQPSGPSTPGFPTPQLTVRVDSHNSAAAIVGVSEVTFDARGTPGDKLRYEIQFGDGESVTTATATHVYASAGTFTATLVVTDAADRRSSTTATVNVKAVTGTWFYSDYNEGSRRAEAHRITITAQDGGTLRGVYSAIDEADRVIAGAVTAERNVHFEVADQSVRFDGVVPGDITSDLSLTVGGSRINGQTLTFRRAPGEATGPAPSARLSVQLDPRFTPFYGAAVIGLTPFIFDASTSSGDSLTLVLEFGDGAYTRELRVPHAVLRCEHSGFDCKPANWGTLAARVVATDRFGRFDVASQNFGPVTKLLDWCCSTHWFNRFENPNNSSSEFRELRFLSHDGRSVAGSYRHPDGADSPFVGTFDGAGGIELTLLGGGITFKGRLVPSPLHSFPDMELMLRGGSADGTTLRFLWYEGY